MAAFIPGMPRTHKSDSFGEPIIAKGSYYEEEIV